MTKNENTLLTLMEECAEVQQAVSKVMRFGKSNFHPNAPKETNEHQLLTEYYQLVATMEYLMRTGVLNDLWDDEIDHIKADKITKMLKWQNVTAQLGLIQ